VKKRATTVLERSAKGGCYVCSAAWSGGGAQGAAARHHDETGHTTWANVSMLVAYGIVSGRADHAPAAAPRTPGATRQRHRARAWRR
jgi:hypothetical protein